MTIKTLKDSLRESEKNGIELKENIKKMKEEKVNATAQLAKQSTIDLQKKEILTLIDEKKKLQKELNKWEKECVKFWQQDPKQVLYPEKEYSVEDKKELHGQVGGNVEKPQTGYGIQ